MDERRGFLRRLLDALKGSKPPTGRSQVKADTKSSRQGQLEPRPLPEAGATQPIQRPKDPATPKPSILRPALKHKAKVDLVVGLDFGTSSTKVAYRELGSAARRVVPFVFQHDCQEYPQYCLPSVGLLEKGGRFVWGPDAVRALEHSKWTSGIRGLKVLVAGEYDAAFRDRRLAGAFQEQLQDSHLDSAIYRPDRLAAIAVAWQMFLVRSMLSKVYLGAELDIRFNVCLPIDQMEHSRLYKAQQLINQVAEEIYLEAVAEGWKDRDLLEWVAWRFENGYVAPEPNRRVFCIPEAVAQVASYITSLESRQGIHAVLDIGAGTTDLSIVNLAPADRDSCWYAARNEPRGGGRIEAAVGQLLEQRAAGEDIVTHASIIKHLHLSTADRQLQRAIAEELSIIKRALNKVWTKGYGHYRSQSAWEGIPLFLCGGGALLQGANRIFAKSWVPNFRDFDVRKLPVPHDYDSIRGTVPFDRLSVAYGLTFLLPELGEFVLPADSPDHTPPKIPEQIYDQLGDGHPG